MGITFLVYKEIISLNRNEEKDSSNIFSWMDKYYFCVFMYGASQKMLHNFAKFDQEIVGSPTIIAILYDY